MDFGDHENHHHGEDDQGGDGQYQGDEYGEEGNEDYGEEGGDEGFGEDGEHGGEHGAEHDPEHGGGQGHKGAGLEDPHQLIQELQQALQDLQHHHDSNHPDEHADNPDIHDSLRRMHTAMESLLPNDPDHQELLQLYEHVTEAMSKHSGGHPGQGLDTTIVHSKHPDEGGEEYQGQ
ncbi:hypothetical protein LTR10_016577 [Elasticomyces elasticus]|uniref:Uncharacterized protein n=1 Tax=Exophiala sideris TaxID=1016849 RepID=A0ABR0JJI5_9EURO|nr:hypothetical protein LTR10_016577 [Elasticomyces elasticus]KAK5035222.1 hypothetical protein LTS07_002658 [Exophiala sideris]KAK5066146.1 hypothetical protein LTR69_002664 [Exophiala sideris]KAK5186823.1 hypothetical protein LTR44_000829 [Eurotiomycetes sp. CCFEE 6388]